MLVAFYSFEGNTKFLAKHIAKTINADIMEIKPVKELKSKSFTKYIWGGWQAIRGNKPELHPPEKDWKEYDMIFIGTPVWAWTASPPIMSYLAQSRIAGKKVALFCCDEGSPGGTFEKMRLAIPDNDFKGEEAFFAPMKKNKDETLMKAVSWAFMMMK